MEEEIAKMKIENSNIILSDSKPDGAFFDYGSNDEFEEYVHMEERGWKGFINAIKKI